MEYIVFILQGVETDGLEWSILCLYLQGVEKGGFEWSILCLYLQGVETGGFEPSILCLYLQGVDIGGFEWSIFIAVVVAAVVFFVLGILVSMCISRPNVKAKVSKKHAILIVTFNH